MLYLQAIIFQKKTHNFNTHAKFMLIKQKHHIDINKKNKEILKTLDINTKKTKAYRP